MIYNSHAFAFKTTSFQVQGKVTQSDLVEAPRASEWQYQVMTKQSAFHLAADDPFEDLDPCILSHPK